MLGGLVEFYRSQGRNVWTPTGTNVPDYTRLSNYWWQFVGQAVNGSLNVTQAMNAMASAFDKALQEIADEAPGPCAPKLNEKRKDLYWLSQRGAPKAKRNTEPKGITLPYEEAIRVWD